MHGISRLRTRAAALAMAITTCGLVTGMGHPGQGHPSQGHPSQGHPGLCEEFRIDHIQRDYGAALEWSLRHRCWFGQQTEVVVTTFADGAEVDRHVIRNSTLDGRSSRYVLLPPKPVCGTTQVRVEARYGDRAIGDLVSSEGTLYYDPNDDC
jgi:hypothetical protein